MNLLVFLLSTFIELRSFLLIDLISSLLYLLELETWYLGIYFFLFNFLSDKQEVFSPIPQNKYQTTLRDHALNGVCA